MNSVVAFLVSNFPLLIQKTVEQLYLSLGAVCGAMVLSIPLGIFIARKTKLRKYVMGMSNILQALPSLAVLGIVVPILGIGVKTALVTIFFYAVLPILRNTVTGFLLIPSALREAADGLGFTSWQKMRRVEFPLALPVMIAGIRTAAVMSVGVATLAAFVGAGGLGDFIYQGLSLNNVPLILLGAVPAALLALMVDGGFASLENALTSRGRRSKGRSSKFIFLSFVLAFLVIFFSMMFFQSSKQNTIVVGSKNFTEQLILGEILAQTLEKKSSLKVIRKFNLGGTFVCHEALIHKDIDLYPEYTGTAYTVILKKTSWENAQKLYQAVKKSYAQQFDVAWLELFGFNNTNALVVQQMFATQHRLKSISDLTPIDAQLIIGVPADFLERPDGFLGLKKTYHLQFGKVKLMDPGLVYTAIVSGKINALMAYSTDARITANHLVILEDNLHLFPPYYAAPIVRAEVLRKHPEVATLLNQLAGKIDNPTMRYLNEQVDVKKRSPAEVAKQFLANKIPQL